MSYRARLALVVLLAAPSVGLAQTPVMGLPNPPVIPAVSCLTPTSTANGAPLVPIGSTGGTDPNNASFGASGTAPVTATVGTSYPVGRSLQTNCTTGGTITFTEAGTAVPWIVGVGTTEIPHATTQVSSAGATSCTFIVHY